MVLRVNLDRTAYNMGTQIHTRVHELIQEAIQHEATNHPYLLDLQNGNFPSPLEAIKDFAIQCEGYTAWFPKYLTTAMSKLDKHEHRMHFIENLSEEGGRLDYDEINLLKTIGIEEEWVQGIPHPRLFEQFREAMGVDAKQPLSDGVIIWREMFSSVISNAAAAEAIGAVGIGTEAIVKYVYKYISKAIQNHTPLKKKDYVFFELHSEIDDEHGKIMMQIAEELIDETPNSYNELRKGMLKALNLRAMFWNNMYKRAQTL